MHSVIRRASAARGVLLGLALGAVTIALSARRAGAQVDSSAQRTASDTVPSTRLVGVMRAGDLLRIHVYRDSELSGEYQIDARGTVQIPGMGVIRAAGLDPATIKERLTEALRARGFSQPELAVYPLVRVSVLGEVRNPSLYSVDPGTSLIQLVTLAGGPSERADLKKTRVVRENRAFVVNLESALGGSASGRVVLNSNDVVYVPRQSGFTRETLAFILTTTTVALSLLNVVISSRK